MKQRLEKHEYCCKITVEIAINLNVNTIQWSCSSGCILLNSNIEMAVVMMGEMMNYLLKFKYSCNGPHAKCNM